MTLAPNLASGAAPAGGSRRAWFFPVMVVMLLLLQIVLCMTGVMIATRSGSYAVESDYYDKALHWDDQQAAERASAALGWTSQMSIAGAADLLGHRQLVLTLGDRAGQPVAGAAVTLLYFHHAHATNPQSVALRDLGDGHYAADLPLARPGTWEFRLKITKGSDQFLARELEELH